MFKVFIRSYHHHIEQPSHKGCEAKESSRIFKTVQNQIKVKVFPCLRKLRINFIYRKLSFIIIIIIIIIS